MNETLGQIAQSLARTPLLAVAFSMLLAAGLAFWLRKCGARSPIRFRAARSAWIAATLAWCAVFAALWYAAMPPAPDSVSQPAAGDARAIASTDTAGFPGSAGGDGSSAQVLAPAGTVGQAGGPSDIRAAPPVNFTAPILLAWLTIAVAGGLRWAVGWALLAGVLRRARAASAELLARAEDCRSRIGVGRHVRVVQSDSRLLWTPFVVGLRRPTIVFPDWALGALSAEELDAVLVHELVHVRRRDYLWKPIERLIGVLFCLDPGRWWISRQLDSEREFACDDLAAAACGTASGYLRALHRLAAAHAARSFGVAFISASGPALLTRVKRMSGEAPPTRHPAWWAAGSATAMFLAILLIAGGMVREPEVSLSGGAAAPGAANGSAEDAGTVDAQFAAVPAVRLAAAPVPFDQLPHPADNPREILLPAGGRVAFTYTMPRDPSQLDQHEDFFLRVEDPERPVCVQVISQTPGCQPFLRADWPTPSGTDADTDVDGGRGNRAFLLWPRLLPAPKNVLELQVFGSPPGELFELPEARFILCAWQPAAADIDPDVLGVESSPILLDENGTGTLPYLRGEP
ncbi:MAG: M56 family metallopeptidase, partial [Planctomycetia bacterium]|nr:M56 family metallopeptidase [Planctomycetia bacterium]